MRVADPHEQQQRQLVQRIVRSVGRLNEVVQNLNSEMEVRARPAAALAMPCPVTRVPTQRAGNSHLRLYPPPRAAAPVSPPFRAPQQLEQCKPALEHVNEVMYGYSRKVHANAH